MKFTLGAMLPEITRHLFKKPATIQVPFEPIVVNSDYRGKPVMDPKLCIGCQRCVKDCPAEALEINKEYEYRDAANKLIRRFSMTLYLDRCTHCSQCEETCPVKAIKMDNDDGHAEYTREALKFVYKPEPPPPQPPQPAVEAKPAAIS